MSDLADREKAIALYDCYGPVLTEAQKSIFSQYYLFDLSLGEIADEKKISRAAVKDSLDKSTKKMEEFENKLNLLGKKRKITDFLNQLEQENDQEKKNRLRIELEEYLRNGI